MKGCLARMRWRHGGWLILWVGVVLVGTRVNRTPTVVVAPPAVPGVFDEVIDDVSVDLRTLKGALESVQRKSAAQFVFEPDVQQLMDLLRADRHGNRSEEVARFEKVRLGVLLAYLLDEWDQDIAISCYVEGSTIVFRRPGAKRAIVRRAYDLRNCTADWIGWQRRAKVWSPGPSPEEFAAQFNRSYGAGAFQFYINREANKKVSVEFINGIMKLHDGEFRPIADWGGWVVLEAPPQIQARTEEILKLWSDCKAGSQSAGEIALYRHGELAGFTSHWERSKNSGAAGKSLDVVIPSVKCTHAPLEKLIDRIATTTGTRIFVDWHALQGASAVGPNAPVTLDLQNVKAADALQLALDQSRHSGQGISFVCADGIVKVSVESQLQQWTLRVYDGRDLIEYALKKDPKTPSTVVYKLALSPRIWVPEFGDLSSPEENAAVALQNVLEDVAQETWPHSGLSYHLGGKFLIVASPNDHRRIAVALGAFRAGMRRWH